MFFSDSRYQFFKPLTSKYREQVVECLRLLYQRLYSANADYGQSLQREQVIEIFEEALARAPLLDDEKPASSSSENRALTDIEEIRFKSPREQATWILKQLLDSGWIEKRVDQATLQSTFPFSRMGRLFTQPLLEVGVTRVRTRHRNTRNTLNALEAFINRGEVHDLLDAYEYSERIIADFTDVIAELEERKRELVQELESKVLVQQATDQFFEFMEKRFQPDLSVRLSADSVEKHRDRIGQAISKIRRKRKETKLDIEKKLRELVPELVQPEQSVLWWVLDTIETRMQNAAEVMLPALRRALHSFTKRADIIIRQLSYLNSQHASDVLNVCQELSGLDDEEYERRLSSASEQLLTANVQLIDPAQIKIPQARKQRIVKTAIAQEQAVNQDAQRELYVQQLVDQAFTINNDTIKTYLHASLLSDGSLSNRELPVESAGHLLALAHIIEAASVGSESGNYRIDVEPTGEQFASEYYLQQDEFIIKLVDEPSSETRVRAEKTL